MTDTIVAGALLRISVLSEDRRLDVAVAGSLPLVEMMPGFARSLGVLDPTLVHGGYALRRADGSSLDPAMSPVAQGVNDGDVLTLVRGANLAEPKVYDDVTEAVLDATAGQHRPWTPKDSTRTALAVSLTFLTLCGVLLLAVGRDLTFAPLVAGGTAVLLLATAAVLGRAGQPESGHALGIAAAAYAALGAFLAIDGDPWGWPLAAAAIAAVIAGGAAVAFTPDRPEISLIPVGWGAVLIIPAVVTALVPGSAVASYAITVAAAASLSNLLPWLAMSSTRIRVISPQSDQEVFADPGPLDAPDIQRRAASGARVLNATRIALGTALLLVTPIVASTGAAGAALTALAFLGMMFQSRQVYARGAVLAVMTLGALGLAVTGFTVAVALPDLRVAMLIGLLVVTAVLVTITLLSPRARLRLARAADSVEVLALAALLPLGVIAAGWV